jgi:hypothetical protein
LNVPGSGLIFFVAENKPFSVALPLIALPGISPRIVTGRKTLWSMFSPIATVAKVVPALRPDPFSPSLYGEKVPAGG